jgi:hypothetical protein
MDCRAARDWLLQAESPGDWLTEPEGPAGHLRDCPRCRTLALDLQRLESDYRDHPLPAGWEQAREAFLARMPIPLSSAASPRRRRRRRWALAAAVLFLVSGGVYLCWPESPPVGQEPPADVVERLIDWNLALTHSEDPAGRRQTHDNEAPQLRSAVAEADLPDDDRDLAESLLASGEFIAVQTDPMDQVDRFNDLADKLLAQIDSATTRKDAKKLKRLANLYRRIAEQGIHANLDRLEEGALNPQRAKKIERLMRRETDRANRLMVLLDQVPRASRKDLRQALTPARKAHRPKKPRKR